MAWIYGNDPTGEQIRQGRILCEAMFAINEREYTRNFAKTVWTDVGADPAVNALAGLDVTRARKQTLITEMHTAIEALVTYTDPNNLTRFYAVGVPDYGSPYSKATLLTDAFGAVDWTAIAGLDINEALPITQILKAIELLNNVGIQTQGLANRYKRAFKNWGPGAGPVGTPALARAQAEALPPGAHGLTTLGSGAEAVNAVPPNYHGYDLEDAYQWITTRIPASATAVTWKMWYDTAAIHDTAYAPRVYSVSAAQWAAPAWGNVGTLRHTAAAIGAVANTFSVETFDDASFLSTGANEVYVKHRYDNVCPFVDDDTDQYAGAWAVGINAVVQYAYN